MEPAHAGSVGSTPTSSANKIHNTLIDMDSFCKRVHIPTNVPLTDRCKVAAADGGKDIRDKAIAREAYVRQARNVELEMQKVAST